MSEEQQKIQKLEFELDFANKRVEYLATRLGNREIELSELNGHFQTYKDAYETLDKEYKELKGEK
ncbi:hypothetical protein [Alkalicoccobacillus gibsonii]|uniref:hypothetical protein n=1 Tax=Alkalicoccobacillus gibsonii TaxID=79881 RepID=UPI0035157363